MKVQPPELSVMATTAGETERTTRGSAIDRALGEKQSRRMFLRTAVAGGCAVAAAKWLASGPQQTTFEPFQVAKTDSLVPGDSLTFTIPGTSTDGLLVRLDQDSYIAVDRRCPHLGCPVLWSRPANQFQCPCHRAEFDARTGAVLNGPPLDGLRRFAVERNDDALWVRAKA